MKLFSLGNQKCLALKWPYLNKSFQSKRKVVDIISQALPGTIILAFVSIILALLIGIFGGVISAINRDSWVDKVILIISVIGMSGPSFFIAILISWIGGLLWFEHIPVPIWPFIIALGILIYETLKKGTESVKSVGSIARALAFGLGSWIILHLIAQLLGLGGFTSWFFHLPGTGLNMTGSLYSLDEWKGLYLSPKNLILPAITLGIRPLGVVVQLTRSSLLEELKKDYIRTARAKGLSENKVVFKHALRNALNPVVTAVSGWFASMLAGAVFVEFVFGWKGLGLEIFNALEKEDFPIVMGAVLVISFMFVMLNILVDILYGIIDPRVRVS